VSNLSAVSIKCFTRLKNYEILSITVLYEFTAFLQEPTEKYNIKWSYAADRGSAAVESISSIRFRSQVVSKGLTGFQTAFIEFSPDIVPAANAGYASLTVAGSPSWDKLFIDRSGKYLSAQLAKDIFREGFRLSGLEVIELQATRQGDKTGNGNAGSDSSKQGSSKTKMPDSPKGTDQQSEQKMNEPKKVADLIGFDAPAKPSKDSPASQSSSIETSLLLLIDTSGSMEGSKLSAAKSAAKAALDQVGLGKTEVAVLTFTGDCASPDIRSIGFTADRREIVRFIDGIQAGGGTPLSPSIEYAANFMQRNAKAADRSRAVILLADGDDNCGNVNSVLSSLKSKGIAFRHETIGLGIDSGSPAARDLRRIASETGGRYHYAEGHAQLADVFGAAVDALGIGSLFGSIR
jgi:Mg-chelatase subunit ChlD